MQHEFDYLQGFHPLQQISVKDGAALRDRLARLGFYVRRTFAITVPKAGPTQAQGSQEIGLDELSRLGVPADFPVNLFFEFEGAEPGAGGHLAAGIREIFGKGEIGDFQRLSASIVPGDPHRWISHLMAVPGVVAALNKTLAGIV